jgi:nucleoside recognition membrane protein YjiH
MRPLFKLPGRSAIDALASFMDTYSIALLITDDIYRQGKYSAREAAVVATGFSTASVSILLIIARELGLMNDWNVFFLATLLVTFFVTAVTSRLWPLNSIPATHFTAARPSEPEREGSLISRAWRAGVGAAVSSKHWGLSVWDNFKAGIGMTLSVIPSIISLGLLGLLLAKYTPLFDVIGHFFYPFFRIFGVSQAVLGGTAVAVGLPDMFLPTILIAQAATPLLKFVVGVVSVSQILFFSASIPCLLGTSIPLKLREILVIWLERVILSVIVTIPIATFLGFADVL